ncbi:HET-domain-containing protein, partial [Zopfia rhizophila CBS 207.26]
LAKRWLDCCLQNHGIPCQRHGLELPTRLVDVGSPDGSDPPKLIATNEIKFPNPSNVKYLALSYCWGEDWFLKTTATTIHTLMLSIPWDELSKTVRDAIMVARRLGIQYLWVDSLCIIQGGDTVALSDWQTESAKMQHIYGGAVLTVAAAHAATAQDGLFHQRELPDIPFEPLNSSLEYPETVLVGPEPPLLLSYLEPLTKRAWALQERLLSNRVLAYGTTGIRWMCQRSTHLETSPGLPYQGFRITPGFFDRPLWICMEWKSIIEEYSHRDLTYITDKLTALSGLAQDVSRSSKKEYFAGLCRSDLFMQMLWIHCGKVAQSGTEYKRQGQYRAPSWSWASVD